MLRLIINPKYEAWREAIERIPQQFDSIGEVLRDSRNVLKVTTAPDGTRLNVKRFHKPRFPNNYVYSLGIRQPKGIRAFFHAFALLGQDIDTPDPVAYIEEREDGQLGLTYFISLQCPYTHRLYELGNAPEGTYEALVEALARFTAQMHNRGMLHLDYSPGNVLWEKSGGTYHFSLVDTNRMYFGVVDIDKGCANFARLWGPKRMFCQLARTYAEERHMDAAECERLILLHRKRFWTKYMRKHKDDIDFKLEL